jgi:hypothetical protein
MRQNIYCGKRKKNGDSVSILDAESSRASRRKTPRWTRVGRGTPSPWIRCSPGLPPLPLCALSPLPLPFPSRMRILPHRNNIPHHRECESWGCGRSELPSHRVCWSSSAWTRGESRGQTFLPRLAWAWAWQPWVPPPRAPIRGVPDRSSHRAALRRAAPMPATAVLVHLPPMRMRYGTAQPATVLRRCATSPPGGSGAPGHLPPPRMKGCAAGRHAPPLCRVTAWRERRGRERGADEWIRLCRFVGGREGCKESDAR